MLTDSQKVSEHIQKMDPFYGELCEGIRQVILDADSQISEQIKWNSPCFYYSGEMKPYSPKEYKREIIVFNIQKKPYVLLVFPSGSKINDPTHFLEGEYPDGRKLAKIHSLTDLQSKSVILQQVIRNWLSQVEK